LRSAVFLFFVHVRVTGRKKATSPFFLRKEMREVGRGGGGGGGGTQKAHKQTRTDTLCLVLSLLFSQLCAAPLPSFVCGVKKLRPLFFLPLCCRAIRGFHTVHVQPLHFLHFSAATSEVRVVSPLLLMRDVRCFPRWCSGAPNSSFFFSA
jgi:hypothetical protein